MMARRRRAMWRGWSQALFAMGCYEVSLGDTIGRGTPEAVTAMLGAVLEGCRAARLAGHFHDTDGRALENIEASLALGLRVFDAAVGGLGRLSLRAGGGGQRGDRGGA